MVDVVDEGAVGELFGALPCVPDVLVNNAGVSGCQESIVESEVGGWWADWVR